MSQERINKANFNIKTLQHQMNSNPSLSFFFLRGGGGGAFSPLPHPLISTKKLEQKKIDKPDR